MPKRILVAPLNWGLGHATRSIPLIRELQKQGAEVFLASDGAPLKLLRKEFPDFPALELPAYNIHYRSANMIWNMGGQLPKIAIAVARERMLTETYVKRFGIRGIISDNRYGCRSNLAKSVFLTHQINIKTPSQLLGKTVRRVNWHFIRAFDECWVPDVELEPNLSGELSHLPASDRFFFENNSVLIRYIGALSRMERFKTEKKYDVIAVLSGPEPQRSKLEKLIIEQAKKLPHRFLLVQGKPAHQAHFFIEKNHEGQTSPPLEVISFLTSEKLNEAILSSGVFIGRSGYSTVMDLLKLGKPALLIPTPGQTEQGYLAGRLSGQGWFYTMPQKDLDLAAGLEKVPEPATQQVDFFDTQKLGKTVSHFLSSLA